MTKNNNFLIFQFRKWIYRNPCKSVKNFFKKDYGVNVVNCHFAEYAFPSVIERYRTSICIFSNKLAHCYLFFVNSGFAFYFGLREKLNRFV
jgi:hypothetical protein